MSVKTDSLIARLFQRSTLSQIIGVGCLLTLLYAAFSRGAYHSDEHYQILEYAHMKLFGTPTPEQLPWEYGLMMRPGLQPLIAYGLGWILLQMNLYSPVLLVFLLQLFSGALSVGIALFFFRTIRDELGELIWQKWFLILSFFLWFMAFLHVHFNAEMLSGNLLLLLISLYLKYRQSSPARTGLILGSIAGLLFIVRFQMGFALLGFGVWLLVFDRRWKLIAGMLPGGIAMLGVGLLCDRWLYGEWCFTPINYLRENILNSHMATFGIEPWYYYFGAILGEGGALFGLLVLIATLSFFIHRPRHILTWTLVPFLIVHLIIGHKELRFLFPLLFFAPYLLVVWLRRLPSGWWTQRGVRILLGVLGVANILLMVYALCFPDPNMRFYDDMRAYCRDKQQVILLSLKNERTYYQIPENVIGQREVVQYFHTPDNMCRQSFESLESLEAAARSLDHSSQEVLILSENPHLTDSLDIPLGKIPWSPFPGWVTRYLNFNNWTSRSIERANLYRLLPPQQSLPPQTIDSDR